MIARTYGKWILAGEHAVLRGCPALVFTLLSKRFELFYSDDGGRLRATFSGEHGPELQPLFWLVIERALALKNLARDDVRGRLDVVSQLPIGAGLGASAALCVAVGRWFIAMGWARADELDEFARGLEDLFHGESTTPFVYWDKGSLATIGRARAVADLGKIKLSGPLAWLVWAGVHVLFLIGFRNRLMVGLAWAWAWATRGRQARLITGREAGRLELPLSSAATTTKV